MGNKPLVIRIAAFDDNYIWLLTRDGYDGAVVVDPGDEEPVIEVLQAKGLHLDGVLVTHKHDDHVGGIAALKQHWPNAIVYGPANELIKVVEKKLQSGAKVTFEALGLSFNVLEVPGHTEGHIAYFSQSSFEKETLFCGDTLFAGGCGRVFSGTPEQLSASLNALVQLPEDTLVYCAHEYTQANLGFAKWVEPDNAQLIARSESVDLLRQKGESSVPSSIADELASNPFVRTSQKTVIQAAEVWAKKPLKSSAEVFRALRTWKDQDYD